MVQVNEITAKTADKCYQQFRELLYNSPLNIPQAYLFVGSPAGKKYHGVHPVEKLILIS